jgi:hypothetical protein
MRTADGSSSEVRQRWFVSFQLSRDTKYNLQDE